MRSLFCVAAALLLTVGSAAANIITFDINQVENDVVMTVSGRYDPSTRTDPGSFFGTFAGIGNGQFGVGGSAVSADVVAFENTDSLDVVPLFGKDPFSDPIVPDLSFGQGWGWTGFVGFTSEGGVGRTEVLTVPSDIFLPGNETSLVVFGTSFYTDITIAELGLTEGFYTRTTVSGGTTVNFEIGDLGDIDIVEPPAAIPLPGALVFFLSGLGLAAYRRLG